MGSKVTVNIFNQEYTISGDESQEKILHIASWVDQKMREIDELVGSKLPTTSLAVLSSINVAKDYFEMKKEVLELKKGIEQKSEDAKRYMELWEETKKNFQEFQENTKAKANNNEELQQIILQKDEEIANLLANKDSARREAEDVVQAKLREAKESYKELENNFFDLQMENIKIKSELEKLRG